MTTSFRAFILVLLFFFILIFGMFAQAPTNGLVAHFPFNGNADDATSNAHHGSVHGATPTTDRFGNPSSAYRFNGNAYLEFADHNDFSVSTTNQLSISVWQKPSVLDFDHHEGGYVHWMGKGTPNQHEYVMRIYNQTNLPGENRPSRTSGYIFNLNGGLGTGSYVQESLNTTDWIHFVLVFNTQTGLVKLYKNGVLRDTDLYSDYNIVPGNGTAPLRIGTRDFNSYFQGDIDDVKIYNRELSATEVRALFNETPPAPAASKKPVVGYIPTYRNFPGIINTVDLSVLTHVDIAFVNPDWNGNISMPNGTATVVNTAHASNVKVLASICGGGGDGNTYRNILSSDNLTNTFVANLVQMTLNNNLDGIDVDIEGDVLNGTYVTAAQYERFILRLRTALHAQGKLMTSALAGWFINNVTNTAAQAFDYIGLMSYDAYGGWTGPGQHSPYSMAVNDFNAFVNKGVDPNKLLVGLPFYGYGWGSNQRAWTFNEIVNAFPGSENNDQVGSGANVIYYNGIPTIKQKCEFAQANAGGVMIWELTQDATGNNSLLKAVGEVMGTGSANLVPDNLAKGKTVSVSSTEVGNNIANHITDGEYATRWSSLYSDAQWFSVDLGEAYRVQEVKITWETALARNYQVQVSSDGTNWSTALSVSGNTQTLSNHQGLNEIARYVRINCTQRATAYGYSVFELEVYGLALPKPYSGTPLAIPGLIQTEEYDLGGEGVAYHDLSSGNQYSQFRTDDVDIEACTDAGGGYNVGNAQRGEWLNYTVNVAQSGVYDLEVRVATNQNNQSCHFEIEGQNISGAIAVPNTGGWQSYRTVTVYGLQLTAGIQQLRLHFDSEYFNINHFTFQNPTVTSVQTINENDMLIYPNPSLGLINYSVAKSGFISVFDAQGKQIYQGPAPVSGGQIDLSNHAPGIYWVTYENFDGQVTEKILIQ